MYFYNSADHIRVVFIANEISDGEESEWHM